MRGISRCLDQVVALPDALVENRQASSEAFFSVFGRPSVNFQPERTALPGAVVADRLSAYLGRDVGQLERSSASIPHDLLEAV